MTFALNLCDNLGLRDLKNSRMTPPFTDVRWCVLNEEAVLLIEDSGWAMASGRCDNQSYQFLVAILDLGELKLRGKSPRSRACFLYKRISTESGSFVHCIDAPTQTIKLHSIWSFVVFRLKNCATCGLLTATSGTRRLFQPASLSCSLTRSELWRLKLIKLFCIALYYYHTR